MAALVCILWQCSSEDFNFAENNPKRNNSDFFKHASSGGLANRGGVDYVSILEDYNEENNFLATMPDQQGMPIWEKMLVLDIGEKTALYIPLSSDENSLSSLLLVSIDRNSEVFFVRNFTNDYLKNYVYNAENPIEKRKFLMDTFLQMDFLTFHHQRFTNLPTDLYDGFTEYNRMNILEASIETKDNGRFIYQTVCALYHNCANNHSISGCDYATCSGHGANHTMCVAWNVCTSTTEWVDDPIFYPSTPSCGLGCGGGGGGVYNPNTPQPPKDDCALNNVFYRMKPACGSTGTGDGGDLIDDPCEKIKEDLQKAKNIMNSINVKNQNDVMITNIITDQNEKGFAFGKDANGVYQVSSIVDLGVNGGYLPLVNPNFVTEGDVHNHNGTDSPPCFSPSDIYGFHSSHASLPTYNIRVSNGSDGSQYVLTITDQALFDQFIQDNPLAATIDVYNQITNPTGNNLWKDDSKIHENFMKAAQYFVNQGKPLNDAYAYGMAFVTKKHNLGVMISQKDNAGNFKPLEVQEKPNPLDPDNSNYEITHPCGI